MQVCETLRQSTKELHHTLDHHPILQELMSASLTLDTYAVALSQLNHWYSHMEERFSHHWPLGTWISKTPLILSDLRKLDFSLSSNYSVQTLSNLESHAFALGVFYVCEGATMGGQIIGPRVEKTLQRKDITNFYNCYGDNTMAYWQKNKAYINDAITNNFALKEAITGAQWAFQLLINQLEAEQSTKNELMYA